MREAFITVIQNPFPIGLGAAVLGMVLLLIALLFSSASWMRFIGISLAAASCVALFPAFLVYSWASSVAHPGGGDFSGLGLFLVPIIFYVIWLPALPAAFLIAVTSPVIQKLGRRKPGTKNATTIHG